jgi:NAD(P)-dependent dehydrogenase (short-subunit alcohol dehydrogenase family)
MELEGRRALVTGGGRGIGSGIVRQLAKAGADIAINYRADEAAAQRMADEVRALGRRGEVYQADVASEADCMRMAQQALTDFGSIDILVHNAGVGRLNTNSGPLLMDQDAAELSGQFALHTLGAFYLCKALVPAMRELERADIVMISSESVRFPGPGRGAYSMAKAALELFASTLAKEERKHGIRVNTVSPGFVDSDMARATFAARGVSLEEVNAASPFGYLCTPEDIGNAVVFFCSENARYITNVVLTVSGDRFSL